MQGIIDMITNTVDWLLGPGQVLLAVVLGLVVSWSSTQFIKNQLVLTRRQTTIVAMLISGGVCLLASPDLGRLDFAVAITVAFAAPWSYKGIVAIGRARGWAWTQALSSDAPGKRP